MKADPQFTNSVVVTLAGGTSINGKAPTSRGFHKVREENYYFFFFAAFLAAFFFGAAFFAAFFFAAFFAMVLRFAPNVSRESIRKTKNATMYEP
jgi:hypothetical protein